MERPATALESRPMPDTVVVRHEQNEHFSWRSQPGPFEVVTEDQARMYDDLGYFVLEDAFDAATRGRAGRRDRPVRGADRRGAAGFDNGTAFIARADEITFTTHLVTRVDPAAHPRRHRSAPRPVPRPDRPGRAPLLGPGRLQEARHRRLVPLAPGQRLRLRRAPAVPHLLDRAHRRDARTTDVPGSSPACTGSARWRTTSPTPGSCASTTRPTRCRCRSPPAASSSSRRSRRTAPGPNRTDEVRKAYIVQYAPDGAVVQMPDADGEMQHYPADDARRQFPIAARGAGGHG